MPEIRLLGQDVAARRGMVSALIMISTGRAVIPTPLGTAAAAVGGAQSGGSHELERSGEAANLEAGFFAAV